MFCIYCGNENRNEARFCKYCGKPMDNEMPEENKGQPDAVQTYQQPDVLQDSIPLEPAPAANQVFEQAGPFDSKEPLPGQYRHEAQNAVRKMNLRGGEHGYYEIKNNVLNITKVSGETAAIVVGGQVGRLIAKKASGFTPVISISKEQIIEVSRVKMFTAKGILFKLNDGSEFVIHSVINNRLDQIYSWAQSSN